MLCFITDSKFDFVNLCFPQCSGKPSWPELMPLQAQGSVTLAFLEVEPLLKVTHIPHSDLILEVST